MIATLKRDLPNARQARTSPLLTWLASRRRPRWGALCVALLSGIVSVPHAVAQSSPPNNQCSGAIVIPLGLTPFTTVGATTDGPALPESCEEGFGLQFVNDVWFLHEAEFTGTLEVNTCGAANFDTRLAAYLFDGSCVQLVLVACNDDGAGCPLFTSIMQVPVEAGRVYALRVGAFFGSGSGIITLTDEISPTCVPANHDCFTVGLPGCSDIACCIAVCQLDPFCCAAAWDFVCVAQAKTLCTSCGESDAGDCCAGNGTPGCDDAACCQAVCANDPFCCQVQWDGLCAGQAAFSAACNCDVEAPAVCNDEAPDCFLGGPAPGCNDPECCALICLFDPFCCEVTWDEVCVGEAVLACAACGTPETGDCCTANWTPHCDDVHCCSAVCDADPFCCDVLWDSVCAEAAGSSAACGCGTGDVCPGAGDCFRPHAGPGCDDPRCCAIICANDPFCCQVEWDLTCVDRARVTCERSAECTADLNGDGLVGGQDLGVLLIGWGQAGPTDLNGDTKTDGADLGILLNAWGACP